MVHTYSPNFAGDTRQKEGLLGFKSLADYQMFVV